MRTGEFGPPESGGRRWPLRRIGVLAGAFVIVVGLSTSVTAGALLWYGERSITRVDVPSLAGSADEVEATAGVEAITEVLNVLLVGDDSRDGLTDEQLTALGTDRVDGGRTDTIMLLQLDPNREQASLLSFPRDLLVTRCDGSRGRINAAYGIGETDGTGGAACLVDTVNELTDIPIHHYVEVNFAGFIDVVDVLGGVTMYIEEPGLRDRHAGLDLAAGCQTLDGAQALGFVRARKLDNDFGRMARQQRFVREMVSEVASAGTLLNVPRLFSIVEAAGRAVETDRDLSLRDMRRIAFSVRNLTTDGLDTRVVPGTARLVNGAAMVVVDEDEAEELFAAFREGALARDDLGREEPTGIDVADVPPLTVLNGTGIAGMAAAAAEDLEGRGFTVAETDNAERFGFLRVRVIHPRALLEEAELVAEAFPDATLEVGDPDDPLTVVIGSDYEPPEPGEPAADGEVASATPTPTPEPEPTFRGATPHERRC